MIARGEQRGIALVAGAPHGRNLVLAVPAFRRQMPRAVVLLQEKLAILLVGELDADRREHFARRIAIQEFGVDEHAVVVPQDRFDSRHRFSPRAR